MAAICHTFWTLDSTELDKWKWASRHMRSRAEKLCRFDTNATASINWRQLTTYLHLDKDVWWQQDWSGLFIHSGSWVHPCPHLTSLLEKVTWVLEKVTKWLQSGSVSIDADYNKSAGQTRWAWTSAGVLQWTEGERLLMCGRSHSQSRSCERFGGRWRGWTRTLAGFDWRSLNWTRAAGCCPPRDSAFSIWSSCSGTRFSPASRSDSETGPGSVFHTLTGTASCETCSPKPPVARTWTPSWRAWAWRTPARSAGVCAVWTHAGWPLDLHGRVSPWGRTPLQAAGRGAPGPRRALDARRVESVRLLPPLK